MEGRNLTTNHRSESQEDIHLILEFSVSEKYLTWWEKLE